MSWFTFLVLIVRMASSFFGIAGQKIELNKVMNQPNIEYNKKTAAGQLARTIFKCFYAIFCSTL